jgi:hypothetical protein
MLVTHGSTDMVLNQHRKGLPPQSFEFDIRPLSTFPSSILQSTLIRPTRSYKEPYSDH